MNIEYSTEEIARYYAQHRKRWADFYDSERWVLERVAGAEGKLNRIFDVGCAVGGLGRALAERFLISKYTGIDINKKAIQLATAEQNSFPVPSQFICGDIARSNILTKQLFNTVCSFGCADWNIDSLDIINACWAHVGFDGHLILSLRLCSENGVNDITKSYQYIHFNDDPRMDQAEKANYVVFNVHEALTMLAHLSPPPGHLLGFGYWGRPSPTAVTPYQGLVFTVIALKKVKGQAAKPQAELHLPLNLFTH